MRTSFRSLSVTALTLACLASSASAQASIDLTVGNIGLAVGDVPRVIGVRLNYTDRRLERVDGLNVTIAGGTPSGTVNGVELGLVAATLGTTNGLALGTFSLRAAERVRGIALSGLVVDVGQKGTRPTNGRGGVPARSGTPASGGIDGIAVAGLAVNVGNRLRGVGVAPFIIVNGTTSQIDGIAVSGLTGAHRIRGIALGALGTNSAHVTGIAIGGVGVKVDSSLTGIGLASLAVGDKGTRLRGIAGSGLASGFREATGIVGSGVSANAATLRGLIVAGVRTAVTDANGFALAGVITQVRGRSAGLTAAPIVLANQLRGVGVGAVLGARDVRGLVIAPVGVSIDSTGTLTGVSISAINANRGTQRGLSIGLYNAARNLHGVQLGLINVALNNSGPRRVLPLINWHRD
jgi:hypothetical protein